MNLQLAKTKIEIIDEKKVEFKFPTLAMKINIEAEKNSISNGQYQMLSLAVVPEQINIVNLLEKVATLNECVKLNGEVTRWDRLDEEEEDFVNKVYESFEEWRDSFRRPINRNVEPERIIEDSKTE